MGRYSGKSCRIVCMLVLTTTFLLVEIIVGHLSNSLALIADAFHMISDTMALVVGLVAVKLSRRGSSKKNTYGWARAEIVGALINSVFLVALSFTIFVEAIERLAIREAIEDAQLLLYVGGAGLAINLVGLCLFHNHAHGHTHGGVSHSHGHSHGTHNGNHNNKHSPHSCLISDGLGEEVKISSETDSDGEMNALNLMKSADEESGASSADALRKSVKSHQLNMRGVFIHVMGDALGSVVVMISAAVTMVARKYLNECHGIHHHHSENGSAIIIANHTGPLESEHKCPYSDPEWVLCIDPILSLVLVAIILCTAVPLLKETALVLMQTVPTHLEVHRMKAFIEKIPGLVSVHEFHVWSLAGNKVIASLHVHTNCLDDYVSVAQAIKNYLHNEGIHSVTIQPEFSQLQPLEVGRQCALECGPDKDCYRDTCCCNEKTCLKYIGSASHDSKTSIDHSV